jgi:hypothetical protein
MSSKNPDPPFFIAYCIVLAIQLPVWLCAGQLWGFFCYDNPISAFMNGLWWGSSMWVIMGNFTAIGIAWRRSAELPATDRDVFLRALKDACDKIRLIVLAASDDEIIMGSKRALIRFRLMEIRAEFANGIVLLSAPALSFGRVRKVLTRALSENSHLE